MYNDTTLLSIADNLIETGRSGLIALCGDPANVPDLKFIVYFHSLGIFYISHGDWGTEYFNSNARGILERVVKEFSGFPNCQTVADVAIDEKAFLNSALSRLLWAMTHDVSDVPDSSDEEELFDLDNISFVDDSFTLFGSGDLEKDIEEFEYRIDTNQPFTVADQTFSLGSLFEADESMIYVLRRCCPDIFVDETTGERIPITSNVETLSNHDWRTLYARARTFIYWKYVNMKESNRN